MLEYVFDIEYLPGTKNYIQDALRRRPDYQEPPILRSRAGLVKTNITSEDGISHAAKEDSEKGNAEKEVSEKEEAEKQKAEKEKTEKSRQRKAMEILFTTEDRSHISNPFTKVNHTSSIWYWCRRMIPAAVDATLACRLGDCNGRTLVKISCGRAQQAVIAAAGG